MPELIDTLREIAQPERLVSVARAALILLAGYLLAGLVRRRFGRLVTDKQQALQVFLAQRITAYVILGLAAALALNELGFQLGAVLGAAGVLTVALGFASQTSMSNIISGLFLIGERPFVVGDVIRVADVTGEVLSVDLLSVKLRTFDNLKVRIPNESLFKTNVVNLTAFPIRRYDLQVGVAYKENLARVREILVQVADANPLVLEEPAPLILLLGFGSSSVDLQFSVWARQETWLEMRNAVTEEVKVAFDAQGVEIPFPHVSLYAGAATEPLPVRILGGEGS